MSSFFSLAAAGLMLAQASPLPPPVEQYPTGPQAGQELAEQLRSARPTEPIEWRGSLKIKKPNQPADFVPISCQTEVTATNWSVSYTVGATAASGAEKLTVVFFTNAPTQYLYARASAPAAALGPVKTLTGAGADIPLGGSDFWLSDLGFEFYHWPDQIRLPGTMSSGRPCYVLESLNPHATGNGYCKVVTWVEKESGQPLNAEAYVKEKELLKSFHIGKVEKINGHWQLKSMSMKNARTGSRTELDFDLPKE